MAQITGDYSSINNNSGSAGNTTLTATATSTNTGRNSRYDDLTGTTTGGASAPFRVIQPAKAEFVEFDNQVAGVTVAANATSVTITGKSNSSKLTFAKSLLSENDFVITSPYSVTTQDGQGSVISVANGASISGDPGMTQQYAFSVTLTFPANTGTSAQVRRLQATTNNGTTVTIVITQQGLQTSIHFEDGQGNTIQQINLESNVQGATATFVVVSNDSWTLAFDE